MKRNAMVPIILSLLLAGLIALGGCSISKSTAPPAGKESVESQWAAATMTLREQGGVPAFEDADVLYYVEAVDDKELTVYIIYRSIDEAGDPQPQIMFSEAEDPASAVFVSPDASVAVLHVGQNEHEAGTTPGAPDDIVPGSIISVWGDYGEAGDRFIAERIVVWRMEGLYE